MTKLRTLASIITVLILAAALSGCPMNGDDANNGNNVVVPEPLQAPQTTLYGSMLSWPPIPGAYAYSVRTGDLRENVAAAGTGTRQFDLAGLGLPPGAHAVTVVALGVPGQSLDSPAATPVTFTVAVAHLNVVRAGINFRTQGDFTQEQIDEILAEIESLSYVDLEQFEGYVAGITIRPEVEGGPIIDLNDNDQAVIFTDSFTAADLLLDLQSGKEEAYAAQNPAVELDHVRETREEIRFRTRGDFTQAQIDTIQAQLDGLTDAQLAPFSGYVRNLTFRPEVEGGRTIVVNEDGISVTVITDGSAGILADLTAGRAAAQEARDAIRSGYADEY